MYAMCTCHTMYWKYLYLTIKILHEFNCMLVLSTVSILLQGIRFEVHIPYNTVPFKEKTNTVCNFRAFHMKEYPLYYVARERARFIQVCGEGWLNLECQCPPGNVHCSLLPNNLQSFNCSK
jgi:hypothetical protein